LKILNKTIVICLSGEKGYIGKGIERVMSPYTIMMMLVVLFTPVVCWLFSLSQKEHRVPLSQWAKEFHEKDQEDISQRIKELGLEDALINLKGLTPGMLVTLGEQKILSLEDFADLASDELTGGYDVVKGERVKIQGYLEDFALSKEEADELIMSARNIVYKD